ncbi:MAG: beta-lactamase family protein [Spirochaetales bacterium]|nr:beta-lactamase family protein [Spirochaetales bacterium]
MDQTPFDSEGAKGVLAAVLDRGIADGVFPGGCAAIRSPRGTAMAARGHLSAGDRATSVDMVYDLASLTKVVSTLPLVLLAIRDRRIDLDGPATRWLPELAAGTGRTWNAGITVRRLLSHSSGLPAWRPYFIRHDNPASYLEAIANEAPSYTPGTAVEYSDLGFMLLGWILERAWDDGLASLAQRLVFTPLGMSTTAYPVADASRFALADCAPTEDGNRFERDMALAYAEGRPVIGGHSDAFFLGATDVEDFPWRRGVIRGEAHDSNCHYGLRGISGHAGVFSTIGDLVRYTAFWDESGPLPAALRTAALTAQSPAGALPVRGLGWLVEDGGVASHTGFTGTSLRYDTHNATATMALTNRIHPRVSDGIAPWRAELAAATRPLA